MSQFRWCKSIMKQYKI